MTVARVGRDRPEQLKMRHHPAELGTVQRYRRDRGGAPAEDGFTIVEMVVALGLLAFIMTAMAAMFYGAANVAVDTKARTQAAGIATRALESMRVSAYAKLGFFTTQTGYSNRCDSTDTTAETVTLTGPDTDARHSPVETLQLPDSDLDFIVRRCVVWANVPLSGGGALEDGYKRTIAEVTWTDNKGIEHRVRQTSIVYPGGFGTYAGAQTHPAGSEGTSDGGVVVSPTPPFDLVVTTPPDPSPDDGVRSLAVAWDYTGLPVDHFTVQWSDSPSFASIVDQNDTTDGEVRSMTVSSLAPSTTYYFKVTAHADAAKSSSSPASQAAQGTTTGYTGGCIYGPITLATTDNPSSSTKIYKRQNNRLGTNLVMTATFSSACSGTFTVQGSGPQNVGPWTLTGSGTSKSVTANVQNENWSPGVYTFQVYANAVPTGSTRTFLICAYSTTPNPSGNAC